MTVSAFGVVFYTGLCYHISGATNNGRRFPLLGVILLCPLIKQKGVVDMITWQDLFMFCMFVIALITLVVQVMR